MMVAIKCPKCSTEGKMSLFERDYKGPYKCWSCRAFFYLTMEDNQVISLDPMTEEEYQAKYAKKTEPGAGNFRIGGPPRFNYY